MKQKNKYLERYYKKELEDIEKAELKKQEQLEKQ